MEFTVDSSCCSSGCQGFNVHWWWQLTKYDYIGTWFKVAFFFNVEENVKALQNRSQILWENKKKHGLMNMILKPLYLLSFVLIFKTKCVLFRHLTWYDEQSIYFNINRLSYSFQYCRHINMSRRLRDISIKVTALKLSFKFAEIEEN